MKPPSDPKPTELSDQVGPPPKAPPGFFGEATYHFKDGVLVYVEFKQGFKPT